MATFWETAAHSVYCMFSLYFDVLSLVIFHFGFDGRALVLIASVPGNCLFLNFIIIMQTEQPTKCFVSLQKLRVRSGP